MSGTGANTDAQGWGMIKRLVITAQKLSEGLPSMFRMGAYGEQILEPLTTKQHKLADEGSYYITRTPTIGTGIPTIAALASFTDLSPFIIVSNSNPVGGRVIYLDYIKLLVTAAGASGTNMLYATKLDTIIRTSTAGSGGNGTGFTSVLQGPVATGTGVPNNSAALIYAGALAANASSLQARVLANGALRTAICVVNDQYQFNFGGCNGQLDPVLASGAAIAQKAVPHPPVAIGPQHSFSFHVWAASQSAATSFEVEIGHVER
jgi:hypothetical protein